MNKKFHSNLSVIYPDSGNVSWTSPSNIALVKYWGKKQNQIPQNPSISFTLSDCDIKLTTALKINV